MRPRRARDGAGPALDDDVFAKVGASATVSGNFLHCLAGDGVDFDGRDELLDAIAPRYAVVMCGTNDIQLNDVDRYADNMLTLSELLVARGVIPLLTSIMPRDDSATADAWVPRYNAVVRGVAQALQVPFIDFHRELVPLPDHGLAGDGIHPSVLYDSGARGCHFTPEGLEHGYNIRNLITLQTLDRVAAIVSDGEPPPDGPGEPLLGDGSPASPFVVAELPFTHLWTTEGSPHRDLDEYTGCDAAQDESGPEVLYELSLDAPTTVRAMVLDRGDVDIDVHLLDDAGLESGCVARDHTTFAVDLEPGTWYLALDTFVAAGGEELSGEYLLAVIEE